MIAEIKKAEAGTHRENIEVNVQTYRGKRFADVRVYYMDKAGDWRPTKKGIALTENVIDDVIEALTKAKAELIRQRTPRKVISGWKGIADFLGLRGHELRKAIIDGLPIRNDGRVWWQYESELLRIREEWQTKA